jgi:hypothetical protein
MDLRPEVFHVLKYYECVDVIDNVKVTAYPAFHCDGSSMFLFQVDGQTILYTGDFRWLSNVSRLPPQIDTIYYDDTFANLSRVPSHEETLDDFLTLWYALSQKDRIYIHAKVLGFEVILRALVSLGVVNGYQVSEHLPDCRRQDFELLHVPMDQTSKIILGDRTKDPKTDTWIVPSMTFRICPKRQKSANVYSLSFATHGGLDEIREVQRRAKQSVACRFTIRCAE